MARSLRYTTFQPGELERLLRQTALRTGVVADVPNAWDVKRRNPLHLRWYDCTVSYPDGTSGTCHYTRQGPKWHLFRCEHGGDQLPYVYHMQELGRDAASIEAMAQEKAASAFRTAIVDEQKMARRIQPPHGAKGDPSRFQIPVERLERLAGKYALCVRLGRKLLQVSATFETLEEANTAWCEQQNPTLVVALAVRYLRRWEAPRFNPLYALHPLKK